MASITARSVKIENILVSGFDELSLQNKSNKRKDDLLSKDFAFLLDHSKKKLSSLDSQRVISVIDDLIMKCETVTLLPFLIDNMDRFSVMLGTDLLSAIKEYDRVQQLYTKALAKLRKLKCIQRSSSRNSVASSMSTPNDDDDDDDGDDDDNNNNNNTYEVNMDTDEMEYTSAVESMNSISLNLSNIVKIIMRLFRINPAAINAIRNERKERSFEANNFIDLLISLREQIFARLVTTPAEERDKQRKTVQVMMREKKAQEFIKKLETELNTATTVKEKMIHEKNEIIRKLKLNIQMIEQDSDLINRKLISDAQKIELAEIKNSDGKKAKLQQELIQLKQKLQTTTASHKDGELALRRRKYKIETEVENWIQKYDGDMTERQDEVDELSEIYAEEKTQLEDLTERFDILEKEYTQIIEQRRIAREKREEAERELRSMVKAATLLQSFWRAYKCRKALKAKQKKGKGKKGKGKKKKK